MYLKEAANLESINEEVELIEPGCNINEDMLDEKNTLSHNDTENILSKNKERPAQLMKVVRRKTKKKILL